MNNKAFWTTRIPYKSSWYVRKLLNHRNEVRNFLSYKISPSSSVMLWHDPWLQRSLLIATLGPSLISAMNSTSRARVSSIVSNGVWDIGSSNHTLAIEFRQLLSAHRIHRTDSISWNNQNIVNLSTIWQSIRRQVAPPLWLKDVWHKFSIKNCSRFLWLALRNRLLTKDRMIVFGFNISENYILYNASRETTEHMCCNCPFSRHILRHGPFPFSLSWSDWIHGNFFQNRESNFFAHLGYLFFSIVVYNIWKERNKRIHNSVPFYSSMQVLECAKRMFHERLFSSKVFKARVTREPNISQILY